MLLYLSGLSLWVGIPLLVVLPALLALCGPVVVRRCFGYERLSGNNEIAGFKFATVGVIYSVMVAFAIIVVWEKFNEAEVAVVQEAGASATLYRLAQGSEPEAAAMRAALATYLKLAIEREWPAMARETESPETTLALDALYTTAQARAHDATTPAAILIEIFKQLDTITQERRVRLHLATGIVPVVVWLVLSCGAILTVTFTFFFATKDLAAQTMMTGILAVLVFMALFTIVSIDHPFTGPSNVGSEPLRAVLADLSG
ncbi:MAG TPA: hypothetical protein VGG12_08945 [Methylovirgula sp.]